MSILPKAIYRVNATHVKILKTFSQKIEKEILKFIWNPKRPKISKAILSTKSKAEGIMLHNSNHTTKA